MTPVITPKLIVKDAASAIDFYQQVFDARELERYTAPDGTVVHAAIDIRGAVVAIVDEAPDWGNLSPEHLQGSCVPLVLDCEDPDAIASVAERAGATIVVEIADQFYGKREGRIRDPFGHLWILSKHLKNLSTDEIQAGVDAFGR